MKQRLEDIVNELVYDILQRGETEQGRHNAIQAIRQYALNWVPEEKNNQKAYFTYQEGFDDGYDACRNEMIKNIKEK